MRLSRLLLCALVISNVLPDIAYCENTVLVATPKRVVFVMAEGDLPENKQTGETYIGAVYKTTLLVKHVLFGSFSEKSVTVNLIATSRENLSKAKDIVVVLTSDEAGELRALGWDELRTIACVPPEILGETGNHKLLPLQLLPSGERCAYVSR